MIEVAEAINGFPVQSDDQLLVLTNGQLQEIIRQATEPLSEEVQELRAEVAALREERKADTQLEEKEILARLANLEENGEILFNLFARLRDKADYQTSPNQRSLDRVDQLVSIMVDNGLKQVSIAQAADLLGLSKERVRQMKPLFLKDSRVVIAWNRVRGQRRRVVIKLAMPI